MPFGFLVLTLLTLLGCKSAGGEGAADSGAGISGPLTMLAQFGSRPPRTCAKVTSVPSVAQAAVLRRWARLGIFQWTAGVLSNG